MCFGKYLIHDLFFFYFPNYSLRVHEGVQYFPIFNPKQMLKTCFSSRKGFHLGEELGSYEANEHVETSDTIGFEQLVWGNDFSYLIPSDDMHDEEEEEQKPEKSTRPAKLERKEMRKLRRQRRKLPKHLRKVKNDGDQLSPTLTELAKSIDQLPDSFELHNTSLYQEDLRTLAPHEWLNDNIIMYIFNIFEIYQLKPFFQKWNLSHNTILLLPPSLCYLILISEDPLSLISMFPENFSKCKFLIIPVNDGGSHWSLCVISVLDKTCYIYDSIVGLNQEENDILVDKFSIIISQLLNLKKFKLIKRKLNTPQQLNDYDCGIFVICLSCFIISELIGAHVDGSSWRLDFDLNSKIEQVDCVAIRIFILRSVIDAVAGKNKLKL